MPDDEKVTVVLVDDDKDFADTRRESILKRFSEVIVIHCLTGTQLETQLQGGLRPDVVIMDYDLSKAGDWQDGAYYTQKLKDDYPDMVVIGCCAANDDYDLAQREKAFMDAGADAFVNVYDGIEALLAELENWLPGDEEEPWQVVPLVVTFAAVMVLFVVVLLWAPQLLFNFYALPVGVVGFAVFAALYHFDKLPVEICLPIMCGALAPIITGGLLYLAASNMSPVVFVGALIVGYLAHEFFLKDRS